MNRFNESMNAINNFIQLKVTTNIDKTSLIDARLIFNVPNDIKKCIFFFQFNNNCKKLKSFTKMKIKLQKTLFILNEIYSNEYYVHLVYVISCPITIQMKSKFHKLGVICIDETDLVKFSPFHFHK